MKKTMKCVTLITGFATIISIAIFLICKTDFLKTIAIIFGTTFYHFSMRLLIGGLYMRLPKSNAVCKYRWFQVTSTELEIYKKLGVKRWKNKMPAYAPELLDMNANSKENLVFEMCRAELVHETIILFSFLPIFLAIFFGLFWVFFITSFLAAIVDLLYVMIQRYNRPRLVKFMEKYSKALCQRTGAGISYIRNRV